MAEDSSGDPTTRVAQTFPLSRWVTLAEFWRDGMPLPRGVDWDAYTVELIERLLTSEDFSDASMKSSQSLTWEGGTFTRELNPDGTLRHLETRGGRAWRHERTVISHRDVAAQLEWQRGGSPVGQIAIVGLGEDPHPEQSCRVLVKAIPLLRDYEWRGQAEAGRPELTDDEVRRELSEALERCRRNGRHLPSLSQLANEHDARYDIDDQVGVTVRTLVRRMVEHPDPFRELVPWISPPRKRS